MLDKGDDALFDWIKIWIDSHPSLSNFVMMDSFPVLLLCEALMSRRPDLAIPLWRNLLTSMASGIMKSGDLMSFPFRAPAGSLGDEARYEAASRATTDKDLLDIAKKACEHGHRAWLADLIRNASKEDAAAGKARALTLRGYADQDEQFDQLWIDLAPLGASGGWLGSVLSSSRHVYDQNAWARHWYDRFIKAEDEAGVFAAHALMRSAIDVRAQIWISREELCSMSKFNRQIWMLTIGAVNKAIKDRREKLKDTLYWTKIMARTHSPWL